MTEVHIRHADDAEGVSIGEVPFGDIGDVLNSLAYNGLRVRTAVGASYVDREDLSTGFVYDMVRDAAYFEVVIEG